jgi:hypothetical protein
VKTGSAEELRKADAKLASLVRKQNEYGVGAV